MLRRVSDELERIRGGDRAAWEQLLAAMGESLLSYLTLRLGKLRERLDPCDVLQEVYLEAHRGFEKFRGQTLGELRAWLYTIADHELSDLRDHHGAKKRVAPGGDHPLSGFVDQLRASRTGPGTAVARQEQEQRLQRALEALPDAEREAVLLHHFHGLTQEQIAARQDLTVKQVRGLLTRGRLKVGQALRGGA